VVEGFDDMPQRRPHVHQNRSIERKVVLLALAGIAAVTALVIVAWKFGGSDSPTSTPHVVKPHKAAQAGLRFVGVGKGTYLEIRRGSSAGKNLFRGTLLPGDKNFLIGKRFWLTVRRPAGVQFKLAGKPVALPAGRTVKVIVTPTKTTRVTG
jgi:hypothetical protein